ncbi:MAG: hypothetical protein U0905_15985 [Pirellulales bacterium]
MARPIREDIFRPDEIAVVHAINRVNRQSYLMGKDPVTGKSYEHRKVWIEELIRRFAAQFGIDLLQFAILSNHFHFILRSRPDIVELWSDEEVAERWLRICPKRKDKNGAPLDPNAREILAITCNQEEVLSLRRRLSDISWWMRLICQRVGARANKEDGVTGHFFQSRFTSVRLADETSLLACAAYVDLNPIRACLAESLDTSEHTSVFFRIQALMGKSGVDDFLCPLFMDEQADPLGPMPSRTKVRCSDKGFLWFSLADYLSLLDWTSRQRAGDKTGVVSETVPHILDRLAISESTWMDVSCKFGKLFSRIAGKPETIMTERGRKTNCRFRLRHEVIEAFSSSHAA